MLRFFLFFIASIMAVGASAAEDVLPYPVDQKRKTVKRFRVINFKVVPQYTVPIQIMMPGYDIKRSVAEISSNNYSHFRAFVEAVTEHVKGKLCIRGANGEKRSLLQFVYWPIDMQYDYIVPVLPPGDTPSCQISSPWIDLIVDRGEVPQIRGIVRWNEHQLLVDQAILAGTKNVPPGMALPLDPNELGYFVHEIRRESAAKPVEARVPPDILWLLRDLVGTEGWSDIGFPARGSMYRITKNGAAGYTQLVLALIDRCFVPSASGRVDIHYSSILDIADPILLEQYKIKTRSLH